MKNVPYDQRIARRLVRPLVNTPVTPNHITTVTLVLAVWGAVLLAYGDPGLANWGAGLFCLARFLDHFDGELARQSGKGSRFGYLYDYFSGTVSYALLFFCMGLGQQEGLGNWAIVLGAAGALAALLGTALNMKLDELLDEKDGDTVGYPGLSGFELEDGIYLLAPITWLGFLQPFFVLAGVGALVYVVWTLFTLIREKQKKAGQKVF